jgi:hypothetical protein
MLSIRKVKTAARWAVESPNLLLREFNRLYHTRSHRRRFNPRGIDVMAADWDNMIVLDACRYDLFASNHELPGELSARESRAAHTSEFVLGNFHERDLTDTVYVTASPIMQRGYPDRYNPTFHDVVNVWQRDGWDEASNSVLPSTMVEYALDAAAEYPDKRLIVHFMQPHYPFIESDLTLDKQTVPDPEEISTDIWNEMMRMGETVPADTIEQAYEDNFDLVQPHVRELLEELQGKSVVTSDHGNMLGERSWPIPIREWGHPKGTYTEELVTVPWLEYTNGPRKEIVAEAPSEAAEQVDEDVVTDRLRHLGYAE